MPIFGCASDEQFEYELNDFKFEIPSVVLSSVLKNTGFNYIRDFYHDIYYEILLTCNKYTHLCRRLVSFGRI